MIVMLNHRCDIYENGPWIWRFGAIRTLTALIYGFLRVTLRSKHRSAHFHLENGNRCAGMAGRCRLMEGLTGAMWSNHPVGCSRTGWDATTILSHQPRAARARI